MERIRSFPSLTRSSTANFYSLFTVCTDFIHKENLSGNLSKQFAFSLIVRLISHAKRWLGRRYSILGSIILSINDKENCSSCLSNKMSIYINKKKIILRSRFYLKKSH